ncbi:RagB/SusD family nutrient uptake outer membrane protein [Phocaeicola sp. HCN-40430]|uniref:RagB/SusD family nutrient uptake outer membrane protein n=1 Tax=Phocaeicola sp. HCN-40430 TaxID=3134664 RepID=UPI0030C3C964
MKLKSIILSTLLSSILLTSCSDFLDVTPDSALPPEEAITEQKDLETALRGLYYQLTDTGMFGSYLLVRGEVGGDDTQTINSNASRTDNYYRFIHRVNNSPTAMWSEPYKALNAANTILAAIKNVPASEARNNAEGEALAIRALCHFELLLTYGVPYMKDNGASYGVPLATKVFGAEELPGRATVAQVYQQIIDDLSNSLNLLSEEKNYGHINRWGAKGLLARVYLYKGDWDNAFKYADEVAQKGGFKLITREDYVNVWSQKENTESVFDLDVDDTESGNLERFGYVVGPKGYGEFCTTKAFMALLNENEDDIRLQLLTDVNTTDTEGNPVKEKRFMNKVPGYNGATSVNNIRVVRLSDIYLIAAEAALRKADKDQEKADFYLNEIIKRAIPSAQTVTATVELVLKERRKELNMEGHRFYDAMRLGLKVERKTTEGNGIIDHHLGSTDLNTVTWDDYRIILAIPQAEIDANPNLKKQQNPGYE